MIPLITNTFSVADILHAFLKKKKSRSSQIARKFTKDNCYFLSEGREALALALESLKLKRSDEIIVPAYICDIVPKVAGQYATVVYADCDPKTLTTTAKDFQQKITKKTKVVIAAWMFGKVYDLKKIGALCRRKNLVLIEDCCQSLVSGEGRTRAGSVGDFTILSFRFSKDISMAKGGALLTDKPLHFKSKRSSSIPALGKVLFIWFAIKMQSLIPAYLFYHLKEKLLNPFFSKTVYTNNKVKTMLSTFEQELVWKGLQKLPSVIKKRKEIAKIYSQELTKHVEVITPFNNSLMRFNILTPKRDTLLKILHKKGFEAEKMYSYSMALLPGAKKAAREILNLPVHHNIKPKHAQKIIRIIKLHA